MIIPDDNESISLFEPLMVSLASPARIELNMSKKDTEFFFDLLENLPEPNAKLNQAVQNYRARIQ